MFEEVQDGFKAIAFPLESNDNIIKDAEKDVEKLNETQKEILSLIQNKPGISAVELAEIIGINARNIQKNIDKLKTRGILERIGADKGGYWKVSD